MGNLILSEIPSDILAEKVAAIVIDKIKGIIPIPEKKQHYISRKQTAIALGVSAPSVDTLTKERYLVKYGEGKRGRYILEEVEAAKHLIYSNKYKRRKI